MDNFFFSINATMPIFLVMLFGYLLRKIGMINEEFVNVANKLTFNVTLPCMVFIDIAQAGMGNGINGKFVAFCALATTVCFLAVWILTRLFLKDTTKRGAFVQASFRSSAAVMGVAFVKNIYGTVGLTPYMILGAVPLYNMFSVIVLNVEGDGGQKKFDKAKLKTTLKGIVTNPIIISILIGLLISSLNLQIPVIASKTISSLGSLASPLALIALGASFDGKAVVSNIKLVLSSAMIKLILQGAVFLPIAVMSGFVSEELVAIIIMLASPTTPSCFIMAKNMKNDADLTASVVVVTTLLASVTLTAWIFILKTLQLI